MLLYWMKSFHKLNQIITSEKDEIISLKEEMNKRRKVESGITPLKSSIIGKQEWLHDVKMECFTEI